MMAVNGTGNCNHVTGLLFNDIALPFVFADFFLTWSLRNLHVLMTAVYNYNNDQPLIPFSYIIPALLWSPFAFPICESAHK